MLTIAVPEAFLLWPVIRVLRKLQGASMVHAFCFGSCSVWGVVCACYSSSVCTEPFAYKMQPSAIVDYFNFSSTIFLAT